jgi:hypothetical protein
MLNHLPSLSFPSSLVSLILSILVLLFQISSLERKGMGQLPGKHCSYVPLDSYPEAKERPGIKVYRLAGYLWLGNATKVRDQTCAFMADAAKQDKGTGEAGGLTRRQAGEACRAGLLVLGMQASVCCSLTF